ncbi:MAG: flagellar biosynthetic protein FliO [Pseudomonadota bacterium]
MDAIDYLRFLGALAATLGLLLFAAWGLRKYGHRLGALGLAGQGVQKRRLEVIETLALGPRQRIAIIRRDGAEHLVAIGPDRVSLIEGGIKPGGTGR